MIPSFSPTAAYLLAGVVVAGGLGVSLAVLTTQTPRSLHLPLVVSALWHLCLLAAVGHIGYAALHVDDPVRYDVISAVISDQARQGIIPDFSVFGITSYGYYCWVAAFYMIFGQHPLTPQVINVLLALVAGVLTYRLTRRVGGSDHAAWLAAMAVLLYPTLALWSVMLLKDILALVLTLVCLDCALTMSERPAPLAWPLLGACSFVLSTIRFYLGVLGLGMGIAIGLGVCVQSLCRPAVGNKLSTRSALVAVAGSALLVLTLAGAFEIGEGPWYLQVLAQRSSFLHELTALSGGGSSLAPAPEGLASTGLAGGGGASDQGGGGTLDQGGGPFTALAQRGGVFAAVGEGGLSIWKFVRFFLVPLPTQTGGALVQIGKLDCLFWWPLTLLGLYGIRRGLSTWWQGTLIILLPIVVLAIFYSVVLNNAGTILRYRAGVFPLGAVLAGLGVDHLAARARAPLWVLWKRVA